MDIARIERKLYDAISLMACTDGPLQERLGQAFVHELIGLQFETLYGEVGDRLRDLFARMSAGGESWPDNTTKMPAEEARAIALELDDLCRALRSGRAI